ncbi:type II secretion system protein [Propionivibrio sp.]|uniref:type II secretion system protein n=1 Tax=Propionivibrio sp. TaxID=2212460 RepID=UPI003BEF68B7
MRRDSPPGTRPGYLEAGFTYLGLLILVAILALATSATLTLGSIVQRREAEQRLLDVGAAYRQAIASYVRTSSPAGPRRYPQSLAELLKDPRYPGVRRHLRQLYPDPITGKAEWGLVLAPGGGIMGIHSLSNARPIKIGEFEAENQLFEGKSSYSEWVFVLITGTPVISTVPSARTGPDQGMVPPILPSISSGQHSLFPMGVVE